MQEEILRLEKDFGQAMTKNDAEAIERFLAADWIIIDPDGGIIDKSRFLDVVKSGALSHEVMNSDDISSSHLRECRYCYSLDYQQGLIHGTRVHDSRTGNGCFCQ
jgi:hypothetical protein